MPLHKVFQFNLEGCERVFSVEFEDLVKHRKNDKVKSIVSHLSPSNLVDSYGETLLHLAAKYNNVELIKFSLNAMGCDIDAKNILGETPLIAALSNNHFEAATALQSTVRNSFTPLDREQSLRKLFSNNVEGCERVYSAEFEELVRNRKSDEVRTILRHVSSPRVVDSYGETLLHLAARHNDPSLIDHLLSLGCDVNARNILGATPLLAALSLGHFEAVATLLIRNADFRVEDAERIVRVLLTRKDEAKASITSAFVRTLRRSCADDLKTLAGALIKAKCPMKFVLRVHDARLTRAILETEGFEIGEEQSMLALKYAMKTEDVENLAVLWRSRHTIASRGLLLRQLHYWITGSPLDWKFVKTLFKRLTEWVVFDASLVWFLEMIFRQSSKRALEVLLLECEVDAQMRRRYDFDVLPCIFGNLHEDLAELALRRRRFDVRSRSSHGMTALHFAARVESCENVRLLLDLGADCDARDDHGFTPIAYVHKPRCAELLLQRGSDLQIEDNKGMSVAENIDHFAATWELMLAKLAVDECRGVTIKPKIRRKIESKPALYGAFYEMCLRQLRGAMMTYEVLPSLTLFRVLVTDRVEDIPRCLRDEETVSMIMEYCRERGLYSFYCTSLEVTLRKVFDAYRSTCRAAEIISEIAGIRVGFDHLVVDRIFRFLTYKDMLAILSV